VAQAGAKEARKIDGLHGESSNGHSCSRHPG
jgi:hypothetical protein